MAPENAVTGGLAAVPMAAVHRTHDLDLCGLGDRFRCDGDSSVARHGNGAERGRASGDLGPDGLVRDHRMALDCTRGVARIHRRRASRNAHTYLYLSGTGKVYRVVECIPDEPACGNGCLMPLGFLTAPVYDGMTPSPLQGSGQPAPEADALVSAEVATGGCPCPRWSVSMFSPIVPCSASHPMRFAARSPSPDVRRLIQFSVAPPIRAPSVGSFTRRRFFHHT